MSWNGTGAFSVKECYGSHQGRTAVGTGHQPLRELLSSTCCSGSEHCHLKHRWKTFTVQSSDILLHFGIYSTLHLSAHYDLLIQSVLMILPAVPCTSSNLLPLKSSALLVTSDFWCPSRLSSVFGCPMYLSV